MTNTMPVLTDEQRKELIEFAKKEFNCWNDGGPYQKLIQIALASLEAEPVKTKLKYSSVLAKFIGETNEVESVHCWVHGTTPDYQSNAEAYAEAQKMTGDLYTAPPVPALKLQNEWNDRVETD